MIKISDIIRWILTVGLCVWIFIERSFLWSFWIMVGLWVFSELDMFLHRKLHSGIKELESAVNTYMKNTMEREQFIELMKKYGIMK